jgi:tetratricopeptide (TPR) repeat protein
MLLGQCGESLLRRDKEAEARAMFDALVNVYPKCEVLDFAYNGLADLAYRAKDYKKALTLYSKALDEVSAAYRVKEATLGKARALAALNQINDAAKIFEQVVGTKEWRGETTAEATFALGDIEMNRADYAKAIGYYQKVFVAYQKFPKWTAKAYIQSARAFEKLGKNQDAIKTYREMIGNEKIANTDEVGEAKKRLAELGQS